jgi:single-strand DNA-binding protein
MAEIVQNPELRSTSDNQMEIAEMFVQFINSKPENPPAMIKVVGWNNLAREIKEKYRLGDRVVIEGRLEMNTIDKPEGYKEKRAQLVASRIHAMTDTPTMGNASLSSVPAVTPLATETRPAATKVKAAPPVMESFDGSDDEIPF